MLDNLLGLGASHTGIGSEVGYIALCIEQIVAIIKTHPGASERRVVALAKELNATPLYGHKVPISYSLNSLSEARQLLGPETGRFVYDNPFRLYFPVAFVNGQHFAHEIARVRA